MHVLNFWGIDLFKLKFNSMRVHEVHNLKLNGEIMPLKARNTPNNGQTFELHRSSTHGKRHEFDQNLKSSKRWFKK